MPHKQREVMPPDQDLLKPLLIHAVAEEEDTLLRDWFIALLEDPEPYGEWVSAYSSRVGTNSP